MLHRWLLLIPVAAVLAAVVGMALADRPVLGMALALAAGAGVAGVLSVVGEARSRLVADRVIDFADGDPGTNTRIPPSGSPAWRRLLDALNTVGFSLQARFDELAGERSRIKRLLDDLPTAVLLFTDRELAYANPAARALFDLEGSEPWTPSPVLSAEGLAGAVAEARETGRTVQVEVQHGGRQLLGRASVTADGEVALVVSDLTDAKRIEAMRRDFVTNASHELKTPVAGIQALSESLRLAIDRDPDRARTMIARLQGESQRLAQLVRELLDLARIEEAAVGQERTRIDLVALVAEQVDRLRPLAAEREITMEVECTLPASVIALPEDIRLVVSNLLENAVGYNRPGGRVVTRVRREGSEVVLEVADTGIGIPEGERDRVFERFYRIDKARSRQVGGTGLGLSIVRHAVQRHGGEITVRSTVGEGSTFRVVLPVEGEPSPG